VCERERGGAGKRGGERGEAGEAKV